MHLDNELEPITKELTLTIPTKDLITYSSQNATISNLVGEFFHNNTLSKNTLSSIINELLTNGLKYSSTDSDITLNSYITNNSFYVLMENICSKAHLNYLNRYLNTVIKSNQTAHELYIKRSIDLSENPNITRAQLGLISLMSNFNCVLDIQTHHCNDSCIVSTKVLFNGASTNDS